MHVCFCIVCIYYTSTQDQIHVTSIPHGNQTSAQEFKKKKRKLKQKLNKTTCQPFKNNPRQRKKRNKTKKINCPNINCFFPRTSGSSCIHVCGDVCVSVCECVCVCVYACVSLMPCLRKWRWGGRGDPQVILPYSGHALQKEPKGRGGREEGEEGSEVKG